MKNKQLNLLILLFCTLIITGQNPYWRGGGNTNAGSDPINNTNNILGTLFNFSINVQTFGFNRMMIDNGAAGQANGRISIGNNLPTGFAAQDRLHLHQTGPNNINNYIRFTNNFTGLTNTDGFRIGNTSVFPPNGPQGNARLEQFEQAPIIMLAPNSNTTSPNLLPYEWFRLQNGTSFTPSASALSHTTDGYIGLNQPNPRSHIEMITPAFQGGEEFLMAKPSDIMNIPGNPNQIAPNVQMGMMNATGNNGQFLPCVFGNINQQFQGGPALQMLGAVHNLQDIPGNPGVMRFAVGKDWVINANTPNPLNSTLTNSVVNRTIFSWLNGGSQMMYMAANGRIRIGNNAISSNPAIPGQRPNNRIEIQADILDPYFDPIGNPVGNPNFGNANFGRASGLRFTFLTSNDLVQVPSVTNGIIPTKVLTTDKNGDVVMINIIGAANNGLSVSNGTVVQLGTTCPATPAQTLAAALLSDRQVPLNGFNFVYTGTVGRVGIGTSCAPNNKLEVDANIGNSSISGLRLTQLQVPQFPLPSNNMCLSVNGGGDVILTQISGGGFGSLCTAAPIPLTGNFQVPLGGFHYKFTGQGPITNAIKQDIVSVGYNCAQQAPYRFSVLESQILQPVPDPTYAGYFKNANISNLASALNITGGVFGEARGLLPGPTANSPINVGGVFEGFGSWSNIGVMGRMNPLAVPSNFGPSRYNIGVAGISDLAVNNAALPPAPNYGIFAYCMNSPLVNYGVYAEVPASTGFAQSFAVYGKAPSNGIDLAGFFDGDVFTTGSYLPSDQMLKQNFDSIPNAVNIINQLKPKTFDYKLTQYPQMNLPGGLQYGLVAQDIQTVIPSIVSSVSHPSLTIGSISYPAVTFSVVEYQQIIPILVRAVQQLSAQNHKLDSLIASLTQTVSACCSNSAAKQTGINGNNPKELAQINVTLADEDVIVLDQNKPNPFAELTTITYNVPQKYGYAQLVFKTVEGRIIKTVDITKKGRGQVNVFANDLSNGLYMYSLIVDGTIVDTKKMVKQN